MNIVAPPYCVQRHGWECALVLRAEFSDRMSLAQSIYAETILHTIPETLGWGEIADMLRLYSSIVVVRA